MENILITGDHGGHIKYWDSETGECKRTITIPNNFSVKSLCFNNDGSRIISGTSDRCIRIWDFETGECLIKLLGHNNIVVSVCFNKDVTKIISKSSDGYIKIWNSETYECLYTIFYYDYAPEFKMYKYQLDFDIFVEFFDETIKIYFSETDVYYYDLLSNNDSYRSFNYDKTKIAKQFPNGTIKIYDSESSECLKIIKNHYKVNSVCFFPYNRCDPVLK